MTDTFSQSTTPQQLPTNPSSDPMASASDRLAKLIQELQAEQKVEPPVQISPVVEPEVIPSLMSPPVPTIEEQVSQSQSQDSRAYAQMMHQAGQKFIQGKPTLTDLLGIFNQAKTQTQEVVPASLASATQSVTPTLPELAEVATPEPPTAVAQNPRELKQFMQALSDNLKQTGKLNLANFHATA